MKSFLTIAVAVVVVLWFTAWLASYALSLWGVGISVVDTLVSLVAARLVYGTVESKIEYK